MSARMPDGRLDLLRQRLPSCVDEEWKREVLAELDRARDAEREATAIVEEFVEMQDEVDKYPTSDAHPVHRARRFLGRMPPDEE